jgi:hypothetical protein
MRHKAGTDTQHNVQEEKEYTLFTGGIAARTEKHRILSVERSDFIKSIYTLDDLEWSSLFLVGNRHPNLDGRMFNHFQRYLFHPNHRLDVIRKHVANIAAAHNFEGQSLYENICRMIIRSIRSYNTSRLRGTGGGPVRHLILNVGGEKRFQKGQKSFLEETMEPSIATSSQSMEDTMEASTASSSQRREEEMEPIAGPSSQSGLTIMHH